MTNEEIKSKVYDSLFGKNGKYNECCHLSGIYSYETVKIGELRYNITITDLCTYVNNERLWHIDIFETSFSFNIKCIAQFKLHFQNETKLPDTYEDYLNYRKLIEL